MTIYELAAQYEDFARLVEDGDIPDEAIADTFALLDAEFDDKADALACIIKELAAEAEAIKQQEAALKERRQRKESRGEYLRGLLSESMKRLDKTKIETSRNVISFRKSTALVIADEDDFKQRHRNLCQVEEVVKIPKKDITDRLKAGEEISGAVLETRQNLQIR